MFSTYDQWKLRSPDDEACFRLRYDPIERDEDEDEWLWLDSIENPQPIDEFDLDEMQPPIEAYTHQARGTDTKGDAS